MTNNSFCEANQNPEGIGGIMPKGKKSKEAISKNISRLMKEKDMPQKQAVAVALSEAGVSKPKKKPKKK